MKHPKRCWENAYDSALEAIPLPCMPPRLQHMREMLAHSERFPFIIIISLPSNTLLLCISLIAGFEVFAHIIPTTVKFNQFRQQI